MTGFNVSEWALRNRSLVVYAMLGLAFHFQGDGGSHPVAGRFG
jgi:hypothetical protein